MSIKFTLTPSLSDFGMRLGTSRDKLKEDAASEFKETKLIGIPENQLRINFPENGGDDIVVERIDPENALGYSVYAGEQDYFDRLQGDLKDTVDGDSEPEGM